MRRGGEDSRKEQEEERANRGFHLHQEGNRDGYV
jgi:hypothetical protein